MSGGCFDYKDMGLGVILDDLGDVIARNNTHRNKGDGYERWDYQYPDDIIAKLKDCYRHTARTMAMLHEVDWLLSGDNGEDTFNKRWKEFTGRENFIDYEAVRKRLRGGDV